MSLEPGACLNRYRVVAKLGEGGKGQEYRAEDTRLARQVAVEVLPVGWAAEADSRGHPRDGWAVESRLGQS